MRHRVIDLVFSPRTGTIDDEPLQRIVSGHDVVRATERFYWRDGVPHLLVSVSYRLAPAVETPRPPRSVPGRSRRSRGDGEAAKEPDGREALEERDLPLFDTLRAWRTARARADAVPPYVILTNRQLAEVAGRRPDSLAALRELDGVGASRVERFGREILSVIETGVIPGELQPSTRAGGGDGTAAAAAPTPEATEAAKEGE